MSYIIQPTLVTNEEIDSACSHVRASVPVRSGRRCVDGRYEKTQRAGTIARPGADFGYVIILLSLNKEQKLGLSPEQLFDSVHYSVDTFALHTDDISQIGCGHIAQAIDNEYFYGTHAHEVRRALEYAENKRKQAGSKIIMDVLHDQHAEKGILVVQSTKRTVYSYDGKNSYFIYDKTRDEEYIRELVPRCSAYLRREIHVEDFLKTNEEHLYATLHLLAPGKPLIHVNVDNPIPQVFPLGRIDD